MDVESNVDANDIGNLSVTGNQPTKIRFEYDEEEEEEAETLEDAAAESSNLDEDSTMCEQDSVARDDKTSADYYFDSYSHFGNCFFLRLYFPSED